MNACDFSFVSRSLRPFASIMLLFLLGTATAFAADEAQKTQDAPTAGEDCAQRSGEARKDCVYRTLFRVQNQQIQALAERLEALYAEAEPEPRPEAVGDPPVQPQTLVMEASDGNEAQKLTAQVHMEKESNRFWLTLTVAFAGAAFLFVSLHHMSKVARATGENAVRPSDVMNVVALHLIVFGILLVVMIADVTDQLTAAAGILGALAGYIFRGVNETVGSTQTETPSPAQASKAEPAKPSPTA